MLHSRSLWHVSCLPPQGRSQASRRPLYPQNPPSTAACPQGIHPPELPGTPPGPHQTTPLPSRSFPLQAAAPGPGPPRRSRAVPRGGQGAPAPLYGTRRSIPLVLTASDRPQPLPAAFGPFSPSELFSLHSPTQELSPQPRGNTPPNSGIPPSLWPRGAALLRGRRATRPLYGPSGDMWRLLLGRGGFARYLPSPARPAASAAPDSADSRGSARCGARHGREREGRRQPLPGLLPRYSVLDAVTWGALAALLLQLVRQISWLRSLPDARREPRLPWLPSLPARHAVVPDASAGLPCAQLGPCFLQNAELAPENSSSGIPSGLGERQLWAEEGEFPVPQCSSLRPVPQSTKENPAQREHLEEAAFQLQQIFRVDISIAFNILGIESMRAGHYQIGYTCFKLAADRGYTKAQFNVGLCYEHGRGTEKDLEKAALYYYRAASSCHPMAQYRYARCLLYHSPENEWHRLQKAVTFLEQAAEAGLTEAQAYLGVFYMRGLQPKEKRGLKYLLLAAKNGDAQSRYHVGVCYEKGLGVQQNLAEAMRHYRQSAAAGNRNAQERLRVIEEEMEDVRRKHPFPFGMRASSSSPCFWATEHMPAGLHTFQPRQPALTLPHSWSADRLHTMTLGGAEWSHALGNRASPLELQGLEPHHCGY
ncbi:death ligand signal enhancer [Phasianus colchicus]|uniref:DAP3 binding cell death enhancer 1 n=1 Tax=Phasianus colchicus TaxID=9054 RepID=A0A669PVR5_PHACC|nr:death ligand signal enhancer [Phasianus colchicus]